MSFRRWQMIGSLLLALSATSCRENETEQAQAQPKAHSAVPQLATESNKLKSEVEEPRQSDNAQNAQNAVAACQGNMRYLAGAVRQWAAKNQRPNGTALSPTDLLDAARMIPGGKVPVCPGGGSYGVLVVGANPQCNVPGHVMPQ